jgi:hypothetical protein
MAAGAVGSVWKSGTWPDTVWEANTWATAVAAFTLMTEGAYMMIDMGGGVVYLKPLSPRLDVDLTTGHIGEIT